MEYRTFRAATVTITAGILGSIIATAACDQPRSKCVTARGDFAATYTLVNGTGVCSELKGDTLGVQSYNELTTDGKNRPDANNSSIAIKAGALGELVAAALEQGYGDPSPSNHPYALGKFANGADPDGKDLCSVPQFAPAIQEIPATPGIPAEPGPDGGEGTPAVDPTDAISIKYEWSNVTVLVSASAPGTQLAGDLKYTQGDCTATYRVNALWPVIACEKDLDCDPIGDESAGRAGSGINPDFPVKCNADLGFCVLSKDVPASR